MKIKAYYQTLDFQFPDPKEPSWSKQVDRWYQLDAFAYGLAQAGFVWQQKAKVQPDFIVLASAEASNRTDSLFVQTAGTSPAKFVHTLPNIRGSSLCQVMNWRGPLLCFQDDPCTQVSGIREGIDLLIQSILNSGIDSAFQRIWVLSTTRLKTEYRVHRFDLLTMAEPSGVHASQSFIIERRDELSVSAGMVDDKTSLGSLKIQKLNDADFLKWLNNRDSSKDTFDLPGDYNLKRLNREISN